MHVDQGGIDGLLGFQVIARVDPQGALPQCRCRRVARRDPAKPVMASRRRLYGGRYCSGCASTERERKVQVKLKRRHALSAGGQPAGNRGGARRRRCPLGTLGGRFRGGVRGHFILRIALHVPELENRRKNRGPQLVCASRKRYGAGPLRIFQGPAAIGGGVGGGAPKRSFRSRLAYIRPTDCLTHRHSTASPYCLAATAVRPGPRRGRTGR